jgi:hypothetical protein
LLAELLFGVCSVEGSFGLLAEVFFGVCSGAAREDGAAGLFGFVGPVWLALGVLVSKYLETLSRRAAGDNQPDAVVKPEVVTF